MGLLRGVAPRRVEDKGQFRCPQPKGPYLLILIKQPGLLPCPYPRRPRSQVGEAHCDQLLEEGRWLGRSGRQGQPGWLEALGAGQGESAKGWLGWSRQWRCRQGTWGGRILPPAQGPCSRW